MTQTALSAFETAQLQRAEDREAHLESLENQITELAAHINVGWDLSSNAANTLDKT